MMDFDERRAERESVERKVKIAGRELRFKPGLRPELFAEYADLLAGRIDPQPTELQAIAIVDATVEAYLEDESVPVWREARVDDALSNPVTTGDMHSLIAHFTSVQSRRPTEPASSSTRGGEKTGMSSTDEASPPADKG